MNTTLQRVILILAGIVVGIVLYVVPDMIANPGESLSEKVKMLWAIVLFFLSIVAWRTKDTVIANFTLSAAIVLTLLLGMGGIIRSNELASPVAEQVTSSSAISASSASSQEEEEIAAVPVTYVKGICNADVPSTWHVRSAADQAVWNTEGNFASNGTLTADYIFDTLKSGYSTLIKPAFYSLAESGTLLLGHSDDPGAEDANRYEIDVLRLPSEEFDRLIGLLGDTPPYRYVWADRLPSRDYPVPTLRDSSEGEKYSGQEFAFFSADAAHGEYAYVIFNRSTDYPTAQSFRESFRRFIKTIDFTKCPVDWYRD